MVAQLGDCAKHHWVVQFKLANCMVYESHLNKAI